MDLRRQLERFARTAFGDEAHVTVDEFAGAAPTLLLEGALQIRAKLAA